MLDWYSNIQFLYPIPLFLGGWIFFSELIDPQLWEGPNHAGSCVSRPDVCILSGMDWAAIEETGLYRFVGRLALAALWKRDSKRVGWGWWFNSSLFLAYPNLTGERILILGIIIPCWKKEKGVFKTEMQPTPKHKYIPMGFYCQNPEMSFIMFTRQPASQRGSLALRLHFPFFVSWQVCSLAVCLSSL